MTTANYDLPYATATTAATDALVGRWEGSIPYPAWQALRRHHVGDTEGHHTDVWWVERAGLRGPPAQSVVVYTHHSGSARTAILADLDGGPVQEILEGHVPLEELLGGPVARLC